MYVGSICEDIRFFIAVAKCMRHRNTHKSLTTKIPNGYDYAPQDPTRRSLRIRGLLLFPPRFQVIGWIESPMMSPARPKKMLPS